MQCRAASSTSKLQQPFIAGTACSCKAAHHDVITGQREAAAAPLAVPLNTMHARCCRARTHTHTHTTSWPAGQVLQPHAASAAHGNFCGSTLSTSITHLTAGNAVSCWQRRQLPHQSCIRFNISIQQTAIQKTTRTMTPVSHTRPTPNTRYSRTASTTHMHVPVQLHHSQHPAHKS